VFTAYTAFKIYAIKLKIFKIPITFYPCKKMHAFNLTLLFICYPGTPIPRGGFSNDSMETLFDRLFLNSVKIKSI